MDVKIQLWLQLTLNQPHLKAGSKDSTLWLWSWRGKWVCPSYKNPSCAGMGTSPPQSRLCAKASAVSPKKENYQAQLHWILQSMQKDLYNLVVAEKKSEKWKKEKWPLREITIQKNPGSDVTQLKQPLLRSGGDFGRAVPPCKSTKHRFSPRFLSGHPELRMSNSSVNSVPIIQQHRFLKVRKCPVLLTQKLSSTWARQRVRQRKLSYMGIGKCFFPLLPLR